MDPERQDNGDNIDDATMTLWQESISAGGTSEDSIRVPCKTTLGKSNPRPRILKSDVEKSSDFELGEQLGAGGMGIVYAANQTAFNREVAVKMVKPGRSGSATAADALMAEAVVTGHLEHPNVVPVYDLGIDADGNLFYAMKEVQGYPWSELLAQKTLNENLEILQRVADTVSFAHSRGILHRDLKPHNIMLGEFGEVMVMDWGASCAFGEPSDGKGMSAESSLCGTPAYMPPEMARGDANRQSRTSDVYLLGAILYQIVSGHPPRREKDPVLCINLASGNHIEPVSDEGELLRIALRAMSTAPADRYADVKAFQQAITDYRSHSESLRVLENARANLEKAKSGRDYDLFSRAVFGFREALDLWPENPDAEPLRAAAVLEYARCAYENSDFELAQSLLDSADPVHRELLGLIGKAIRDRDAHKRRSRRLLVVSGVLGVMLLLLFAVAFFMVRKEHRNNLATLIDAHYGEQNYEAAVAAFWEYHDRYGMESLDHDTLLDVRVAANMSPWRGAVETGIETPLKIMSAAESNCVWVIGAREMKKIRMAPDVGYDSATMVAVHDFKFGKRLPPGQIIESIDFPFELSSGEAVHESTDGTLWAGSGSTVYKKTGEDWIPMLDIGDLEFPPLPAEFGFTEMERMAFWTKMELEARDLSVTGLLLTRAQDRVAVALGNGVVCWIDVQSKECLGWFAAGIDFGGWLEDRKPVHNGPKPFMVFSPEERWLLYREGYWQKVVCAIELPEFHRKKYFLEGGTECLDLVFPTEKRCWGVLNQNGSIFSPPASALSKYPGRYNSPFPVRWRVYDRYEQRKLPSLHWNTVALSADGSECMTIDLENVLFAGSTIEGTGFDFSTKILERDWVDSAIEPGGLGLALTRDGMLHAYNFRRYAVATLDLGGVVVDVCGGTHPDHCFAIVEKPHGKNDIVEITGIRSASPQARVVATNSPATRICCDPQGRWLVALEPQETAVLNLKTGESVVALSGGGVYPIRFDDAGEYLICGGDWSWGSRVYKTGSWEVADQMDPGRAQITVHCGTILEIHKYRLKCRPIGQTNLVWKSDRSSEWIMPYTDPDTGHLRYWHQSTGDRFERFDPATGEFYPGIQDFWRMKSPRVPVPGKNGGIALLPLETGQLEIVLLSDLYPLFDSRFLRFEVEKTITSSETVKVEKTTMNSDASTAVMAIDSKLVLMNLQGAIMPRATEETPRHYVSKNGLGLWPYSSWATAARSPQAAVSAADDGDEVVFDRGVFQINQSVFVRKSITLRGRDGAESTVIDAGGSVPAVELSWVDGSCRIEGLTLTGGDGWGGGGILNRDSRNITVSDCIIENNSAGNGGGINLWMEDFLKGDVSDKDFLERDDTVPADLGLMVISNCVIRGNSSVYPGGGINLFHREDVISRLLVVDSEISGNSAGGGGGILISNLSIDEQVNVVGCRITDNKAKRGGGILATGHKGGCEVRDTVFKGNTSGKGKDVNGATLVNCTVEP